MVKIVKNTNKDRTTIKGLNAWELGQIILGLRDRSKSIRADAHQCDVAAKSGIAGDDLRLTASHIDELIDRIENS